VEAVVGMHPENVRLARALGEIRTAISKHRAAPDEIPDVLGHIDHLVDDALQVDPTDSSNQPSHSET
jgi:hypothetical protein